MKRKDEAPEIQSLEFKTSYTEEIKKARYMAESKAYCLTWYCKMKSGGLAYNAFSPNFPHGAFVQIPDIILIPIQNLFPGVFLWYGNSHFY